MLKASYATLNQFIGSGTTEVRASPRFGLVRHATDCASSLFAVYFIFCTYNAALQKESRHSLTLNGWQQSSCTATCAATDTALKAQAYAIVIHFLNEVANILLSNVRNVIKICNMLFQIEYSGMKHYRDAAGVVLSLTDAKGEVSVSKGERSAVISNLVPKTPYIFHIRARFVDGTWGPRAKAESKTLPDGMFAFSAIYCCHFRLRSSSISDDCLNVEMQHCICCAFLMIRRA